MSNHIAKLEAEKKSATDWLNSQEDQNTEAFSNVLSQEEHLQEELNDLYREFPEELLGNVKYCPHCSAGNYTSNERCTACGFYIAIDMGGEEDDL